MVKSPLAMVSVFRLLCLANIPEVPSLVSITFLFKWLHPSSALTSINGILFPTLLWLDMACLCSPKDSGPGEKQCWQVVGPPRGVAWWDLVWLLGMVLCEGTSVILMGLRVLMTNSCYKSLSRGWSSVIEYKTSMHKPLGSTPSNIYNSHSNRKLHP